MITLISPTTLSAVSLPRWVSHWCSQGMGTHHGLCPRNSRGVREGQHTVGCVLGAGAQELMVTLVAESSSRAMLRLMDARDGASIPHSSFVVLRAQRNVGREEGEEVAGPHLLLLSVGTGRARQVPVLPVSALGEESSLGHSQAACGPRVKHCCGHCTAHSAALVFQALQPTYISPRSPSARLCC